MKSRRSIAKPFIVTFAVLPLVACAAKGGSTPPNDDGGMTHNPPYIETHNPPEVDTVGTGNVVATSEPTATATATATATTTATTVATNDPRDSLPEATNPKNVSQWPDGSCRETFGGGSCPPGAMCNPPPPRPVKCPAGMKKAP